MYLRFRSNIHLHLSSLSAAITRKTSGHTSTTPRAVCLQFYASDLVNRGVKCFIKFTSKYKKLNTINCLKYVTRRW